MNLKLVKENVPHIKCAEEVSNLLSNAGFLINNEKKDANMCQFQLSLDNKEAGYLRFYQKRDRNTTIDLSQIKLGSSKEKVKQILRGYLDVAAFEEERYHWAIVELSQMS